MGISVIISIARHFLKHSVDHADMEVHMLVQARAEAVNEGHGADVQGSLVHIRRTRAMSLQALRDDPQKDAQHHVQYRPITLHEVTQPLRH